MNWVDKLRAKRECEESFEDINPKDFYMDVDHISKHKSKHFEPKFYCHLSCGHVVMLKPMILGGPNKIRITRIVCRACIEMHKREIEKSIYDYYKY